ncbi:amino acid/amide ABC transporter substrate-binding protein (HAAT family) [Leucobacter komagatae]|uniref:Amino acid/amide ABC transporter substrate-binding protein (HAAT family) n=1 Tax=Leucobacter komagatae TaxID=55969 RepID=A0A542Y4V4_9MICO|nr:ABC transporter substrate-binding protein [Leucobacter komagatae]TQL43116.1 amino acid/amide ABC transporter substrate-binding protein (HAAT family) [Leucobacter komagatae]
MLNLKPARVATATAATVATAATAALAIALAGCSTPSSPQADTVPGVTADSITIGTHTPLTGPAAPGYSSVSAAALAYFEYINDQGGINGRTINYIIKDDGYNPANTQMVVRELVQDDQVFAIFNGIGTAPHTSVLEYLNENKIPDLFVATGSKSWNQPEKYPYTFAFNADYSVEGAALAQYASDEFPGKQVCVLGQDDDLGGFILEGVESSLGADGITHTEQYSTSNPDITAQIGAMRDAGCEINILGSIPAFTALAMSTAARIGWETEWFATSVGIDYTTLIEILGEDVGPAMLTRLTGVNYLPGAYGDNDWAELFREVNETYNGGVPFNGNIVFGMSAAYLFAEALEKLGDTPTREGILEVIRSGELVGNGVAPLSFSSTNHGSYFTVGIVTVDDGVQAFNGVAYTVDDGTATRTEMAQVPLSPGGMPPGA